MSREAEEPPETPWAGLQSPTVVGHHRPSSPSSSPPLPPSSPSSTTAPGQEGDGVRHTHAHGGRRRGDDGEEDDCEVVRLRAEVERLRAGQARRGEQLRRLMAELKAVRAGRAGAETAFEQLNEAVAGLRREEERRADEAVAERDRARAALEAQRAAMAEAEARAEVQAHRADGAERHQREAEAELMRLHEERSALQEKLTEEQQRADRVLIHNLQLASRVRQLEQALDNHGGVESANGADGAAQPGSGVTARVRELWNMRDRKGMMVLTVVTLLLFWYLSRYYL